MTNKMQTNASIPEKPAEYADALKLAEAGQTQKALASIQNYLASAPDDPEALNDAGAILFSLGDIQKAIDLLEKARNLYPDAAEILWNLVEAYLAAGKAEQAIQLFDDMQQQELLSPDVLNRTADVLLKNNNLEQAVKVLTRSLEMAPEQEILQPMIDVIRSKMNENTR